MIQYQQYAPWQTHPVMMGKELSQVEVLLIMVDLVVLSRDWSTQQMRHTFAFVMKIVLWLRS